MTEPFAIYFLDVGQGDCSLLIPPSGDPVLMDCRSAFVARQFIKDQSIGKLGAVVVSHLDRDHIDGMLEFLTDFMHDGGIVGEVYVDTDRPKLTHHGRSLIDQCLKWYDRDRFQLTPPTRDDHGPRVVSQGTDWRIEILSPRHAHRLKHGTYDMQRPNPLSVVLRIHCFGKTVLIGGDATIGAWERVEPNLLKADIFRVPHHGGDISEGATRWDMTDFYRQVSPEVAVFSVGTNNGNKHPVAEHVRAAAVGGTCRRLCTQLTARCHDHPLALRNTALKNISRIGYPYSRHVESETEVPCAGTVLIRVDPRGTVSQTPGDHAGNWHDKFVALTGHPLCRPSATNP